MSDPVSRTEVDALAQRLSNAVSEATTKVAPRTRQPETGRQPGTALVLYRAKPRRNEAALIGMAIAAATLPIVGYGVFQHTSPTAFFSKTTSAGAGGRVHPRSLAPPPPMVVSRPSASTPPSPAKRPAALPHGRRKQDAPHAASRKSLAHRPAESRPHRAPISETERTRRLNVRELHRIIRHHRTGQPEAHRRNAAPKKIDRVHPVASRAAKPIVVERDNSAQAYAEDAAITRRLNLREQQRERRRDRR